MLCFTSFNSVSKRLFSVSESLKKAGCSIVQPVHHTETYRKRLLSDRNDVLKVEENDIKSHRYKPLDVRPDRLINHYYNSVQPDLLLMAYEHEAEVVPGLKRVHVDNLADPYHINISRSKVYGKTAPYLDRHPVTPMNIPELLDVNVICMASQIKDNKYGYITAKAILQQITNNKPETLRVKHASPKSGLRYGNQIGGHVNLKGFDKSQFLLTLNEIVLPKNEDFKGLLEHQVDHNGALILSLGEADTANFPEIFANRDLWSDVYGLIVNIRTTSQDPAYAKMLVSGLGFPFHTTKPVKETKRV